MPGSRSDYLFVFSAKNDDLRFYGRVMPWYHNGFTSFADAKRLSGRTFCHLPSAWAKEYLAKCVNVKSFAGV